MLFLRFIILIIIILGVLIYLIANRIRSEFYNFSGKHQLLFGGHSEEFKNFCNKPPSEEISKTIKLQKKLSIALIISIFLFIIAVLSALF
jgi:uncharacterized membrane protein